MTTAMTRLSSKGQVVIPASIRRQLRLRGGEELSVEVGRDGPRVIVLRGRSTDQIERLLERGYQWLEQTGDDPVEALHDARRTARARERHRRRR